MPNLKLLFLIIPLLFSQTLSSNDINTEINLSKSIKEKKIYPKGKKIFEKLCKEDIKFSNFNNIEELKESIKKDNLCKKMSNKNLETLTIFLWDVKRLDNQTISIIEEIHVHDNERCPVCAMFVSKYPRWTAQVFYKDKKYSFDGVKDLMKFYFEPSAWGNYPFKTDDIKKILVTDYYTQEAIDGFKAFYVLRSDVYGPMGHELIPFELLEDAQTFKKDHNAKEIIKFDNITKKSVYKLDEL